MEPQDNVRGLLMEAVKETKITLIHRLNVKTGTMTNKKNLKISKGNQNGKSHDRQYNDQQEKFEVPNNFSKLSW